MGNSDSVPRKFTVENDDPTGLITVSERVVDHLIGNQEVRNQETTQAKVPPQQGGQFPILLNEPNLNPQLIRQAAAGELKKNDDYWLQRLRNMEEKHKKMNEVMDEEYKKAVEELTIKKVAVNQKLPPCKATERAVKECYLEYPNEPMRCAKVVKAFQECIDLKRNTLLSSKG